MLLVYRYRVWDKEFGAWVIFPEKMTADRIAKIGGTMIPRTGELIDPGLLDSSERYHMPRRT